MPNKPKANNSTRKMFATNGWFYPIVGMATLVAFTYMSFGGDFRFSVAKEPTFSFVERVGNQFMLDGKPFYINGWNSYWLMDHAVDGFSRPRVKAMLQAGSKMGLTVCRTWAFNDGTYHALQVSPGVFDEQVFQSLDYVIAEARRNGVRLILSLVNNLQAYGGKTQYVKWAWQEGIGISASNDSFFYDPSIQTYFKNYVKTMLTRKNTITGIEYRDDPVIFAWELINEPRCMTDPSGDTLQDWIKEMSEFVKAIDEKHLVTVGLEGFYGLKNAKSALNPSEWEATIGTDFIRNNDIPTIDFASVHMYPDQWLTVDNLEDKLKFVKKWVSSHIEDGDKQLKKPVMLTEFGLSSDNKDFDPSHRDRLIKLVYDIFYKSAKKNGSGAGSFIWQFFVEGMNDFHDDFGLIPWKRKSTYDLITGQSCRLALLHQRSNLQGNLKNLCLRSR
ncbi:mannan endo-1,4-beta-mannosidase 2-like [Amaranthus tricolor]|uniref:mannan endo-1,4-beta-mannosidase 2-like n=1 Tax=Amaranthus tricolor TaxID=29722 RepID=UPI00258864E3|nr:mannan endo-1,4-beta-mannosidase 2-like [Amaranthus tricolor]XP_057527627.1 mannan endo-1,4-beta-mannosidase 2-like [Amaranthus tricolor]